MTQDEIKNAVDGLVEERDKAHEKIKDCGIAIETMQKLCAEIGHDFEYHGHDNRDDYYRCKYCGFEERR